MLRGALEDGQSSARIVPERHFNAGTRDQGGERHQSMEDIRYLLTILLWDPRSMAVPNMAI